MAHNLFHTIQERFFGAAPRSPDAGESFQQLQSTQRDVPSFGERISRIPIGLQEPGQAPATGENLLFDIARQFPRSALTIGQSILGIPEIPIDPNSRLQRALFGTEPTRSAQELGRRFVKGVEDFTGRNLTPFEETTLKGVSIPIVIGFSALDLTPFGGVRKVALKKLATTNKIDDVRALVRKLFPKAADDVVEQTARQIARTTDTAKVGRIIKNVERGAIPRLVDDVSNSSLVRQADEIPASRNAIDTTRRTAGLNAIESAARAGDKIAERLVRRLGEEGTDVGRAIEKFAEDNKAVLDQARGRTQTFEEAREAARFVEEINEPEIRKIFKDLNTRLLATADEADSALRQAAEAGDLTPEILAEQGARFRAVVAGGSELGRGLSLQRQQAQGFDRLPAIYRRVLQDTDAKIEEIAKAAAGRDLTNPKEATAFYREFIKPTFGEVIDDFRYVNLLSSPLTHIVNASTNLAQASLLRPATKLVSGVIDWVASGLTGRARQKYVAEVSAYARGSINSIGDGFDSFRAAMRGDVPIRRPDVGTQVTDIQRAGLRTTGVTTTGRIPTGGAAPEGGPVRQAVGGAISTFTNTQFAQAFPRALEGGDRLFRTIIAGGEREAIALRFAKQGKAVDASNAARIEAEAQDIARRYLFRADLDPVNKTGQGNLLTGIDQFTAWIYQGRELPVVKWFVPFVATPMQIFKMGLEFSPAGFLTIPGARDPVEQLSKALIGSMTAMGSAYLAGSGNLTWDVPSNEREREAFFASGREPFSIRVGEQWVQYSRMGPIAYPLAMAASWQWNMENNPRSVNDDVFQKAGQVVGGIAEFFASQTYLEGIGDLVDVSRGKANEAKVLAGLGSQVVPVAALQRWANSMWDPIFRKPDDDTPFITQVIQNVARGIPGASLSVPETLDVFGEPATRDNRFLNAFSPLRVGNVNEEGEDLLQTVRGATAARTAAGGGKDKVNDLALETFTQLQTLPVDEADELFRQLVESNPLVAEKVADMKKAEARGLSQSEQTIKALGVSDGTRAFFIFQRLNALDSSQEQDTLWAEWVAEGLITNAVAVQIAALKRREAEGLPVTLDTLRQVNTPAQ